MKKDIILIGGGGHCKSCIDIIESSNSFNIIGIIDNKKNNETVLGYKIIGNDDDIIKFINKKRNFIITIGQITSSQTRRNIFNFLKNNNAILPVIISNNAYTSKYSEIDIGTIVMNRAFINSDVKIGENCIINSGAIIEHDVKIGNNCHISTSCVINGNCKIGNNIFIGSNATVINGLEICDNVIIGAGSIVNKRIENEGVYVGNPLRRIK